MRNGLEIFDADAHVVAPKNLWDDTVDFYRFPDSPMLQRFEETSA